MPLLIASSRISGKPSKREESTNTAASAMSEPMSSAGPSMVTESSSPCCSISAAVAALEVPAAAQPQRPVGVRLRGRLPGGDQQLEALLVAEAPGRVDGLGGQVGLRAGQRPHGVGDDVQRRRLALERCGRSARGPARSAPRTRRAAGRACASTCAAPRCACCRFICSSPTARRPGARRRASIRFTPGRVPTRIPVRPRSRRTSWMSVQTLKLVAARSADGISTLGSLRRQLRQQRGRALRRSSRSTTGHAGREASRRTARRGRGSR